MKTFAVTINGKGYILTPPAAIDAQDLEDYAKRVLPDPVAELIDTAMKLPEDMREKFITDRIDKAIEDKRNLNVTFSPERMRKLLENDTGARKKVFRAFFRQHQPQMTEDECYEVYTQGMIENPDQFKELAEELDRTAKKVPMSEEAVERAYFRGTGKAKRATRGK